MKRPILAFVAIVAWPLLTAGSCATTSPEPVIKTITVNVPTRVPCVPEGVSRAPEYADTDEALLGAPGPAERFSLLAAGRVQRIQRQAVTEPILEGCR